jgi:hypothetical protein
MQVFINEREVGPLPETDATIGEIVEAVAVHIDPGEIVTAIEIDGVAYNAGDEERYTRRRASAVRRLVVTTKAPDVFTAAMRAEVAEALSVVATKVEAVVALFRGGDERGGNGLLAALMEELRLVLVLDHQLTTLERSPGTPAVEDIGMLAPKLLDAQERRAWPELSALLAGQLVPTLRTWSRDAGLRAGGAQAGGGGGAGAF